MAPFDFVKLMALRKQAEGEKNLTIFFHPKISSAGSTQ